MDRQEFSVKSGLQKHWVNRMVPGQVQWYQVLQREEWHSTSREKGKDHKLIPSSQGKYPSSNTAEVVVTVKVETGSVLAQFKTTREHTKKSWMCARLNEGQT